MNNHGLPHLQLENPHLCRNWPSYSISLDAQTVETALQFPGYTARRSLEHHSGELVPIVEQSKI